MKLERLEIDELLKEAKEILLSGHPIFTQAFKNNILVYHEMLQRENVLKELRRNTDELQRQQAAMKDEIGILEKEVKINDAIHGKRKEKVRGHLKLVPNPVMI